METLKRVLQSWGVPVMMTGVYVVLMVVSDTSTTGKAWMAIGLGFVFVVWFVFRLLMTQAALSRAVSVGDTARVLELTDEQLARTKQPAARVPLLVDRALAFVLRGDWAAVRAALEEARLEAIPEAARPRWQVLSASARVGMLVEQGAIPEARRVLDAELQPAAERVDRRLHPLPYLRAQLATGRVLAAEGDAAGARTMLQRVLDDVRAQAATRALAHAYLARLADSPAAAAQHRAEITRLVTDASAWVRA
jgi:hypothetical protein